MIGPDFRQQQELEERERHTMDVLYRVDHGMTTHDDAVFLASELGLTTRLPAALLEK